MIERRTWIPWVILILLLVPSFLYAGSFEGKVVGISDGDTIKVLKDGQQVKIRLAAIDCPEKKHPMVRKPNSSQLTWLLARS